MARTTRTDGTADRSAGASLHYGRREGVIVRRLPEWSTVQLLIKHEDGTDYSYGFTPDDFVTFVDNCQRMIEEQQLLTQHVRARGHRSAEQRGGAAVNPSDHSIPMEGVSVREFLDRYAVPKPEGAPRCPYCDRVMSNRESFEQGACNDCYGGAYDPAPEPELDPGYTRNEGSLRVGLALALVPVGWWNDPPLLILHAALAWLRARGLL